MDLFNNYTIASECLLDKKRTKAFREAIRSEVKPTDIVLDAGTGTGIMALFAAEAGAKKVYGVEIAPDVAEIARSNIKHAGFKNKIEVLVSDIRKFKSREPVDILVMEMFDTGMIAELQGEAIKALWENGVINEKTRFIPGLAENYLDLIEYNFNFYGFEMPFTLQARNFGVSENINRKLSGPTLFASVDLTKPIDTCIDSRVKIQVLRSGKFNAVRLRTKVKLNENLSLWGTSDMNMPVIYPVKPKKVKKGEEILAAVSYSMGEGFSGVKLALDKVR